VGFFVDRWSGGIENWRGGWPIWLRMREGGHYARGELVNEEIRRYRFRVCADERF